MMTRQFRSNLRQSAENQLMLLMQDNTHDEVNELAVNFHGILKVIMDRYSLDSIIDLVPEIVKVLNRLDASLKVNEDLTEHLKEISDDNNILRRAWEREKVNKQNILEESLNYEQDVENERIALDNNLKSLKITNEKFLQELKTKEEIVRVLQTDLEDLKTKLREIENENKRPLASPAREKPFKHPKRTIKLPNHSVCDSGLEINNRFSSLNDESILEPATTFMVKALVHDCGSASSQKKGQIQPPKEREKRNILVLSDSHGRGLSRYIEDKVQDFSVTVLTKPGAKLKHIVKEGYSVARKLSSHDWVIILAGTNDFNRYEPSQLTIHQGMKALLSWKINANILVMGVPLRYDQPFRNNNIYFMNGKINQMIKEYQGTLKLLHMDLNDDLLRSQFTKHGLHLNKKGKRFIGKKITEVINGHKMQSSQKTDNKQIQPQPTHLPYGQQLPISKKPPANTCPSWETIETIPESQPSNSQVASSPLIYQQTQEVSTIYTDNSCIEEPFYLSIDDFPPLPRSPGAQDQNKGPVSEPVQHFLEVEIDSAAIQ